MIPGIHRFIVSLVAGILLLNHAYGQTIVRGKISDESGETLVGATVSLKSDPTTGTISDFDGNYSLRIPAGQDTLLVSYISYQTIEEEISAESGDVVIRNFIMVPSNIVLEDVVVIARARRADDSYMQRVKIKSAVSLDYISKETIQKTGDSRVDDAIKRVPGVSTVSGFVTVRGLADRYVKTTINGSRIPTLDPLTNNIKLDIFPTSLIDNLVINKTQSPDRPADWAGAYLSVETKDYPQRFTFTVKSTFGYIHETTFRDYVASLRSPTDWLGFDNGFRDITHYPKNEFPYYNQNPTAYREFIELGLEDFLNGLGINESHIKDPTGRYANNTYYKLGLVELGYLPPAYFYNDRAITEAQQDYFYGKKQEAFEMINRRTEEFGQSIPNTWLTIRRKAPLGFSQDISVGDQVNLLGRPLGILAGLRYSSSVQYDGNASNASYLYNTSLDRYESSTDYHRENSVETNRWSMLLTAAYKLNSNNSISFTLMPNYTGINKARVDSGFSEEARSNFDFPYVIRHTQNYEERRQIVYQLRSTHFIPGPNLRIDFTTSFADGKSSMPDYKTMSYGGIDEENYNLYKFVAMFYPEREFRYLDEDIFDSNISVEFPFLQKPGLPRKFKFGAAYLRNIRETDQFLYTVRGAEGNEIVSDVEAYFDLSEFGINTIESGYKFIPLVYGYDHSDVNFTTGVSNIFGAFGMIDYAIIPSLRVSGGARIENTDIFSDIRKYHELGYPAGDQRRVYPQNSGPSGLASSTADPAVLKEINILPSVNLIYKIAENEKAAVNARANFSKSLARPSIRELSPFWAYDYELSTYVIGNPNLENTRITNTDLRLESFFQSGSNLIMSLFYKDFEDHIEIINEGIISWKNAQKGEAFGIELEGKLVLFGDLEISGNFTYVYSRTTVNLQTLGVLAGEITSRPMFGQAPYIVNGLVSYQNDKLGIAAGLSYNVQGPKLALTSVSVERPDIYELPQNMADFRLAKTLGRRFTLEFKIRNLLRSSISRAYDGDGKSSPSWSNDPERVRIRKTIKKLFTGENYYIWNIPYDSYNYGTGISLGISYDFSR